MYFNKFPYYLPYTFLWHQIGAQITQTGTALRFTGKNAHAIMVMLKIVSAPISIPLFRHLHPQVLFFAVQAPCAIRHGSPPETGALETGSPSGIAGFSTIINFTGGNSLKKENNTTKNQLPGKKKFRIPYQNIIVGAAAFAYFFTLQTNQALASDMWSKADTILKDVYGKILGISTIAAIVTASVALLLMNFSKSGRTVEVI